MQDDACPSHSLLRPMCQKQELCVLEQAPSNPWKIRGGRSRPGHTRPGHTHLDGLLPDGGIGVQEAMHDVGKDLGIDCWLIKVLDELLHLWPRYRV